MITRDFFLMVFLAALYVAVAVWLMGCSSTPKATTLPVTSGLTFDLSQADGKAVLIEQWARAQRK